MEVALFFGGIFMFIIALRAVLNWMNEREWRRRSSRFKNLPFKED